ncbi:MAG: cytochrome-c peroxidase [Flavobacteriales bacterium]
MLPFRIALITVLLFACKKNKPDEPQPAFRGFVAPGHFPSPVYNFNNNPVTGPGLELGRKLFYDPFLSKDNTVSCASCHFQSEAFSDPGMMVSMGVDGKVGARNSPALFNLAWHSSFMWDGGINHIEIMPLAPITDSLEMDISIVDLLQKLNNHPQYPALFKKAFNVDIIDDQKLFYALTQFMGMLISANSKYDRYVKGVGSFTQAEKNGYDLFRLHCESCHKEPLFTSHQFENNGLDNVFFDLGRMRITLLPQDEGKFKIPSLRNVALTYPYMHDGRFASLDQVLDHYASGIKQSATLSPKLQQGIPLTNQEKDELKQFLYTLTDHQFVTNPRFSQP